MILYIRYEPDRRCPGPTPDELGQLRELAAKERIDPSLYDIPPLALRDGQKVSSDGVVSSKD
jgi:hypothetical protein